MKRMPRGWDCIRCIPPSGTLLNGIRTGLWQTVVLCDLPCSGYGVLRRKPEIRQHPPEDGTALAKLQRELLAVNSRYVKPGGILIYSTCTLSKQENQDNVNWFFAVPPGICSPLPLPEDLGELGAAGRAYAHHLPPSGEMGDGLFYRSNGREHNCGRKEKKQWKKNGICAPWIWRK